MTFVNSYGRISRVMKSGGGASVCRDWWLIKFEGNSKMGRVDLGRVVVPAHLVGKRVRFKVEVLPE